MIITPLELSGLYLIEATPNTDDRGAFARTFCANELAQAGIDLSPFVQMNQSWNTDAGTLRGMHYQSPPFEETKLVRCIRGSVYDCAIDIRPGSHTYLKHYATTLSESNYRALLMPAGFAHGFITLEPNTQLMYAHTAYYQPGFEQGMHYADPAFNIQWPMFPTIISEKDKVYPHITLP
jgi:dTDP-4-dehydrorhamnose 3,5-epimerase